MTLPGHSMPRYFIDTFDHVDAIDEEGTEVPDQDALRLLLRSALADILRHEGGEHGVNEYAAAVRDENGHQVMSARIRFSIKER